jgi:hemerythrin-like domain-containing protein
MPIDAFEMALVHNVFRSELESAPELIRGVQPGQRSRLRRVSGHIANVLAALHHHHMAEDELLWPLLHARTPLHATDIQRMESEHELIAKAVGNVAFLLTNWITASHSATADIATQTEAADMLVSDVMALGELAGGHLEVEEMRVVPLINENMTDAEWRAVTERGGSFLSARNMWFGLAFAGMALEACTVDERRSFLAAMPAPQRLLVKLFGRRAAASYCARLKGARVMSKPAIAANFRRFRYSGR